MPKVKLRYPLEDQGQYPATIKFEVYETIPPTVHFVQSHAAKNASASTDNASSTRRDLKAAAVEQASQTRKLHAQISSAVRKSNTISTGNTCTLFMPQALQINDGVSYENASLGAFGGGIEGALNSGTDGLANAAAKGVGQGINDFVKLVSGAATQDNARIAAARFAPGASIGGAVRSSLQVAPNPNSRTLFQSVGIREFSFTFKLIPKSFDESNEITKIIRFFRTELYPETMREGGIDLAYKFPNKIKVKLLYNDIEYKEDALSFELMYIKTFNAVYNPTQSSFFQGGRFSEVDISLTMAEDRALDKKDVDVGLSDEKGIVNATNRVNQYLKTGLGGL